ncbi:MAG: aminopeptidase [Gammaproteobacteria bacterium]|nr:aminopeptidase [Gammaproteobacteria bacterium]
MDCALAASARKRAFRLAMLLVCTLVLGGCANVQFYAQAVAGQSSILFARQDAQDLIEAPDTDPTLVRQLQLVSRLLRFAQDELRLPVDGRYCGYVELDGVPVWNVVAAPEFAVEALPRCYPLVGCAVYRGYFTRRAAEREAARLSVEHDVHLYPVTAYSTLGWFDDPILSSFVHYDEAALADLIFHELAHSVVYAPGDSGFNEAFAGFVGNEGAMRWLAATGGDAGAYRERLESAAAYAQFLSDWRVRLADLFSEPIADAAKRQLKAELFAAMLEDYRHNRERLGGGRYDATMAAPFNNARLALVATYEDSKRDFERLFVEVGKDWQAFYEAVAVLAALPMAQRWRVADPPSERS